MNKMAAVLLAAVVWTGNPGFAEQTQKQVLPDRPNANARDIKKAQAPPAGPMIEVIQGLYLSRIQQQTEINDEQYTKLRPLLQEYLRDRSEIGGPRRVRAQRQLFQAVNRGATDAELSAFIKEFDRIDADVMGAKERFLSGADPSLTVRQRARLRVFLVNMENQVNQLIRLAQSPNPPRRP